MARASVVKPIKNERGKDGKGKFNQNSKNDPMKCFNRWKTGMSRKTAEWQDAVQQTTKQRCKRSGGNTCDTGGATFEMWWKGRRRQRLPKCPWQHARAQLWTHRFWRALHLLPTTRSGSSRHVHTLYLSSISILKTETNTDPGTIVGSC